MSTSSFNKFNDFSEQLTRGVHQFATHTYKVALSNTAPTASNVELSDITQIAGGGGYTTGGNTTTISVAETSGTTTVSGTEVVWTGTTGGMAAFRYAVLYNDTATSPSKPLVGWFDYGSSLTVLDGDTFTVKFSNATPGAIFTLA
jgi:hypothetical protein